MHYTLTRTVTRGDKNPAFYPDTQTRKSIVTDADGTTLMSFTAVNDTYELTVHNRKYVIEKRRNHWYQDWKYYLVDPVSSHDVASIEWIRQGISEWLSSNPRRPNARITFGFNEYEFRCRDTGKKAKLLDRRTWGHHHFSVLAPGGITTAEYILQLGSPSVTTFNLYKPFEGELDATITDPVILALGLFLIDMEFLAQKKAQEST